MIVIDAPAAVELLKQTVAGMSISLRISSRRETLHAPHLIDIELAQVFRRLVAKGEMTAKRGHEDLEDIDGLLLRRYGQSTLMPRIWILRNNLSVNDATYVALAEALAAPMWTCDRRLARPGLTRDNRSVLSRQARQSRIRRPNRLATRSTSSRALLPRSSRKMLSSTTSSEVTSPESCSISMMRCASR